MAAKRIPQLDALTSASVAGADQLVVFDTDANATKRVTRADLYAASNGATYVGYLQSGTDAEPRSVQSKLSDVVSVKDFGAVGDGVEDDTAAIQAALNYAVLSGVRLQGVGDKTYRITQPLTANGRLDLDLCGDTIDGSEIPAGTGYNTQYVLRVSGSIGSDVSVTTDVSIGDTTIVVSTATGLADNDYILLSSDQLMVDGYGNPSSLRGELSRIKSISSTTLTTHTAALFSYAAASSAKINRITPALGVHIRNGKIIGGGASSRHTGLQLYYCVDFVVEDLDIDGGDDCGLSTFYCYGGLVRGGRITRSRWLEPSGSGGSGYGVSLYYATRDVILDGIYFSDCRRGVTGGGRYPSVFNITRACVAEGVTNGFGGHEPCWWWTVEDCVVRNATGVGINCRGQFTKVHRCKFINTDSYGIIVRTYYPNPLGVQGTELIDNEFVRTAGIYLNGDATDGRVVRTTIRGGRHEECEFNNIVIVRSDDVLIEGIRMESQQAPGANDGQAVVVSGSATSGDQCSDIVINGIDVVNAARRGVQATYASRLQLTNSNIQSTQNHAVFLSNCQQVIISNNHIKGAVLDFTYGIRLENCKKAIINNNILEGNNDVAQTSNHGIGFVGNGSGNSCEDNQAVGNTISGFASAIVVLGINSGTVDYSVIVGNNGRNCYGATKFNITGANQQVANNLT